MSVSAGHSVICPILIGRAAQVATVDRVTASVARGHGQTLLVAGEAGIGKSRLAEAVRIRVTQQEGWQLLKGHCFETERGLPYGPIIDLLRTYGIGRSAVELVQTCGPDLAGLLPELSAQVSQQDFLTSDNHRLFHAMLRLVDAIAAREPDPSPVLFVVEDLHWCDEASLELLLYLARHLEDRPVLLLLTYRSDEVGPQQIHFLAQLDRARLATEVVLTPLGRGELAQMLQAIFPDTRFDAGELVDTLYALTEGNPFFVEEVLKSMIMAGDFLHDERGLTVDSLKSSHHVPRSIQAAVQQRSRQLSEGAVLVMRLAAVAGRRFDFELLQRLTDSSESALLGHLKELIAAQLIVEESADHFVFRHALTREAVYGTFLARERRRLHREMALMMETLYGETEDPHVAELAYHFYQGEVWDKTLIYAQQAGDRALSLYAPLAAIDFLSHALEAAGHLADTGAAELLLRRGQARATVSEFDGALKDYQAALAAAIASGNNQIAWESLVELGNLWATREYELAGSYFQQAQDMARTLAEPALIANALNSIGNWRMNRAQPFAAVRDHQEALAIFETLNDVAGIARTLDLLAISSYNCGDLLKGQAYYRQAIPYWLELGDRRGLMHTISGLALAADFDLEVNEMAMAEAVDWAERSLQVAQEIGWRNGEVLTTIILGLTLRHQGDYGKSLRVLQRALAIAEDIEHHSWIVDARFTLGALFADMLVLDAARLHLEETLVLANRTKAEIWIYFTSLNLARVYGLERRFDQAHAVLNRIDPGETPMQTLHQRFLWLVRAELALAEGEPAAALEIADRLIRRTTNLSAGDGRVVPHLWLLRGQALTATGRPAEAEPLLEAAVEVAIDQGRQRLLWRLHAALAEARIAQGKLAEAARAIGAARTLIETIANTLAGLSLAGNGALDANFLQQAQAMLPKLPERLPRDLQKEQFGGLTAREREVALLVAQGKTNREIADVLVLSERTAERHVANIMAKLAVNNRAQIAAWVVDKGLTAST